MFDPLPRNQQQVIQKWIKKWEKRWSVPGLSARLVIAYSDRLQSSWGRSSPRSFRISLHPDLRRLSARLPAVLCHEVAHIAAFVLYGDRIRPHGIEWRRLVQLAGYMPRASLRVPRPKRGPVRTRPSQILYEHRCPVCQFRRLGKRPCPSWRCADCVAAGLDGRFVIKAVSPRYPKEAM